MPWIQNVPMYQIQDGTHRDPGKDAVLIQIVDPGTIVPMPKHRGFSEGHVFEFLDVEYGEFAIRPDQARRIAEVLRYALTSGLNVLVHCHMGICRSGAVAEAGEALGFEYKNDFRRPNLRVKRMVTSALKLGFDHETSAFTINNDKGVSMNIDTIIEETRAKRKAVEEAEDLLEEHFAELASGLKPRFKKYSSAAWTIPGLAKKRDAGTWPFGARITAVYAIDDHLQIDTELDDHFAWAYLPVRYLDENWEELLATDMLKAQSEADHDD